jgi:hypothetical protein
VTCYLQGTILNKIMVKIQHEMAEITVYKQKTITELYSQLVQFTFTSLSSASETEAPGSSYMLVTVYQMTAALVHFSSYLYILFLQNPFQHYPLT